MIDNADIIRMFTMEGATHLYSSEPFLLTPADLYHVNQNPVYQQALQHCNIYMIVCRERIYINPEQYSLHGRTVRGTFIVSRPTGRVSVSFEYIIPERVVPDERQILEIAVDLGGTKLVVITPSSKEIIAVSSIVAQANSHLTPSDTDLNVMYVGKGIGRLRKRTAVDRLRAHSTLQRILAEMSTHFPSTEVLLLLYRFEHSRTIISSGANLNVEPQSSAEEDSTHMQRLSNVTLSRDEVVSLAEAGLINYFKPHYNELVKRTDFASKSRLMILERLINRGITGLIVEICSANIRSRLGTQHAILKELTEIYSPEQISGVLTPEAEECKQWQQELHMHAHTHIASFPLTNQLERNTFMHGTVFLDDSDIKPEE
ncbi:hypothetical protein H5A34_20270 [Pectobacterium brasiliense]|uniref:hypothetical protein n=1 Tax=Pectobacterium brasiliense TaxID=180957 RepID=UPI00196948CB|nr:hypothetical protein [Pectobacterium brasiliense]MBN3069006.1 hypothetical protein [Pectobacterium brasiliense]MBN3248456.1 hypothetical protein [Pectobacterium brasiliense]